jgi:hypothetical protein
MHNPYRRLVIVTALSLVAWGLSRGLQDFLVEPHMSYNLPAVFALSPVYPLIAAALAGGVVAASLRHGVLHAVVVTAVYVGADVAFALSTGNEYMHDLWVGDPGFIHFVAQQILLMFVLSLILIEGTVIFRVLVRRVRDPV